MTDSSKLFEENKVLVILSKFDSESWSYWIEDILNYGVAYPISKVTVDGDPIVEIVNFLRGNKLSVYSYEKAIGKMIKQLTQPFTDSSIFLERLINACVLIKGGLANSSLLSILNSRDNKTFKGSSLYIKTNALMALSRSSSLSIKIRDEACNYILIAGMNDMKHDPAFFGCFLRFSYLQYPDKVFFENLEIIVNFLTQEYKKNQQLEVFSKFRAVINDKIEELRFRKAGVFWELLYNWYLDFSLSDSKNNIKDSPVMYDIFKDLTRIFNQKVFDNQFLESSNENFERNIIQYNYAIGMYFLLNFEYPPYRINIAQQKLVNIVAFIFEHNNKKAYTFFNKLAGKNKVLFYECFSILPFIISKEVDSKYSKHLIREIVELFDYLIVGITVKQSDSYSEIFNNDYDFIMNLASSNLVYNYRK